MPDFRFTHIYSDLITRLKDLIAQASAHAGFRRYFANTSWMLGEQLLRMLSGLLVGIWVARYLGPAQFGLFSYAIAFVSVFATVAKLGLDGIIVRDLVNDPSKRDAYLGTAFWLKFAGAIITLALIGIAIRFTNNDYTTNIYIFIISGGIIFQSFEIIDFYFQSKVLSKFVSTCKIIQLLISSILKIYFVIIHADLFWFVVVTFIDQATLAIALYISYRYQKLGTFYPNFDLSTAKRFLNESWPLIFSGFAIAIYMRIDQIMINEIKGEREVGLYSAAIRLSEVWYFIPVIITNSLFPAILSAKKISNELYFARLQKLYTFLVWMAIAIALPMTFLSNWLVTFIYGDAYRMAGQVLMIHIWGAIFVFFGIAWSRWMLNEHYQKTVLCLHMLSFSSNIALNFLLIPKFGAVGAAIATCLSYSLGHTFFALFFANQKIAIVMLLRSLNPFRKAIL